MAVYNKGFPRLSLPGCVCVCVCIREERDREYSYSLVETGEAVNLLDKEIFNWVGARLSQAKYLVLAPPCPVSGYGVIAAITPSGRVSPCQASS